MTGSIDRCRISWHLALLLLFGGSVALAGTAAPATDDDAVTATTLDTVYVEGDVDSAVPLQEGQGYRFSKNHLDAFGDSGGDPTRVLELMPNVQFSEDRLDADQLNDLRPQSMSISGGKSWDNTITLDGLSIDNRLDPSSRNQAQSDDVAGHEQGLFIDAGLIESITVYPSNVPARFGRFNGGVVDMTTRDAGTQPETRISLRRTDAGWVDYHIIDSSDEEDPLAEPPEEPEFRRSALSVMHARPIGDSGIVAYASANESETPTLSLGRTEYTRQAAYTGSLKFTRRMSATTEYELSLKAAPYSSDLLIDDAINSDYTVNGGGGAISGSLLHQLNNGDEGRVALGISHSENSRDAPNHFYNWAITRSRSWGIDGDAEYSREGGYGDLDKSQTSINLRADIQTTTRHWHQLPYRLNYGTDLIRSSMGFERRQDHINYGNAVVNPDIQCRGYSEDCVDYEQFFSYRNLYMADDVSVSMQEWGNFVEAEMDLHARLQLRIGLRHDYNSYTGNHDLAWRSFTELDVLGDQQTYLSLGSNRYYGSTLLTYKLREARKPYISEYRSSYQNIINDWGADPGTGTLRYAGTDLDTPYSDELTAAIKQRLFGGVAEVRWLQRKNADQISSSTSDVGSDGYRVKTFNNDGSSRYDSVSLSWDRNWQRGNLGFNVTWSESVVSNEDYNDPLDPIYANPYVWYNNARVDQGKLDILRQNFARPLMANAYVSLELFDGFVASLSSQWRDRYDNIVDTGTATSMADGQGNVEVLPVYADRELHSLLLTDLRLQWNIDTVADQQLELYCDINNITNARTYRVDPNESGIEVGRNYWLGLSYAF